jgi:cyclopropane fatty-acyl-phospholipid synthase-like methyltransferase
VRSWVAKLDARLRVGARVLDLGCGSGMVARRLAERYDVTGVDISRVQLERARRNVPQATFLHADAAELDFSHGSFDAVVSTFVFGHIPRAEQGPLLERVQGWLGPGGWLLVTLGAGDADDAVEPDWLGAPMFFASFDPETNLELLENAGFRVAEWRVVPMDEPGHGRVSFMWVLARSPDDQQR